MIQHRLAALVLVLLLSLHLTLPPPARAQIEPSPEAAPPGQGTVETIEPREQVREAVEVLRDMQEDAGLRRLLDQALGVFVVPDYGTAALVIGAAGGEGVLLVKEDGEWARPGFYAVGSLSAGLQAGVAAGSVAMLLNSERALAAFGEDSNTSLTVDAGFSIVEWSARARGELGRGSDVVVWTDMDGLFAALALGIDTITWDSDDSDRYYGQATSPQAILAGEIRDPNRGLLQQALKEP